MPVQAISDRFIRFVEEQKLFTKDDLLILAVSGGVDSIVLLDLCRKAGFKCIVAHVNFNLRKEESKRDEEFVTRFAAGANVEVLIKDVNTTEYAALHNLSIQVAARVLRYEWFESLRHAYTANNKAGAVKGGYLVVTG